MFGHMSIKEKVLRNTHIRSMHEKGEIKRVEEFRADEVSVQKLMKNHETVPQLTSQLHQVQEQMYSMNDYGGCQDVESNYCGRSSHVSSQPSMIPFSRSLLRHDKRLPLDTWNQSGVQENVFLEINVLRLIHAEIILKEFNLTTCQETEESLSRKDEDYPHK